MMRAKDFINEYVIPKTHWDCITSNSVKQELGHELINLVKHAYSATQYGSFINNIHDVLASNWFVLNWEHNTKINAAVFYRNPRGGDNWSGHKIQGLGHDGKSTSKRYAIKQIQSLLNKPGWWIECRGPMATVLLNSGLPPITDEQVLQKLFDDPNLHVTSANTYKRKLPNGHEITELVFGNPITK